MKWLFPYMLLLLLSPVVLAQKVTKVKLLGADFLEYDESLGTDARRLMGNVRFEHENATMFCDSAYMYPATNSLDAFGKIRINQGDTLTLTGDSLKYFGNAKRAEIRGNVFLQDPDITLTAPMLTYDLNQKKATYTGGGKIISRENNNTLTSRSGFYFTKTREFFFKDQVHLVNPQYEITSDTLKYNTATEITYFYGPTTITSEANTIYCENGWYNTKNDIAQFNRNAVMKSEGQTIRGDSLYYDRKRGYGTAFRNVEIRDTAEGIVINGQKAFHWERDGRSMVTGIPVLTIIEENDSLFLHGDTLISLHDTVADKRTLLAFRKVKFFKHDMQGKCDSLSYSQLDSMLNLFYDPVLWNEGNQLTAEKIEIKTDSGRIENLYLRKRAFMVSQEDSAMFNQIKGRNMTGTFRNNELAEVFVEGNGETLYFIREEERLTMMNKAVATNLRIQFENRELKQVTFLKKPEAKLFPLKDVVKSEMELKDFRWRESERPRSKNDIFKR